MTISTKFNVGDRVWFIAKNRLINDRIIAINTFTDRPVEELDGTVYKTRTSIEYMFVQYYNVNEYYCFKTKEELVKFLEDGEER